MTLDGLRFEDKKISILQNFYGRIVGVPTCLIESFAI